MPSMEGKTTNPDGTITPQERSRIEASVRGLEQAPSARQQLGSFANWKQVQDQLGQPFNNERIPLNKLKLMRRDPMIGFGLHFTKTPLVRAPWYIKSTDPQVAAFLDGVIRPVLPSLIIQCLQKLDFGFQAIAKRFSMQAPDTTYVDPASGQEVPAWATQPGNIQPITLKPFVALPPESCAPIFDDSTGEFNGINFTPPSGGAPSGVGAKKKGAGGSEGGVEIDLYHSLWVTNEKESVFGNIYGYPRLGYAYPYWWSYWFRWAIADRAFERKGDPPTIVRHPEGTIDLGNGEVVSTAEYALLMGDRLRAGATVALPSGTYMGLDDKPSAVREWDIEFLKDGMQIEPFDKSFDYLDVAKLRAIFVPEQALIEGSGGTSSRNVAKEMYQGLVEAQSILMQEVVEIVNRFIIPHLLIVNFGDLYDQGIRASMEMRGFVAQDMEMLQQVVQLIGQADADLLGVDIRKALRDLNMPLVSEEEYARRLEEKAAAAAAAGPGEVEPTRDSAGIVPSQGQRPSTVANSPGGAGTQGVTSGSATGFSYVAPLQVIEFSDSLNRFTNMLPDSDHYADSAMKALARQLWNLVNDFYSEQYESFAQFLEGYEGDALHLSDDQQGAEFAASDFMRDMARRIVGEWRPDLGRLEELVRRAEQIMNAMAVRASAITRRKGQLENEADPGERESLISMRASSVVSKTITTARDELENFVANYIAEGELDPKPLASNVRAHFSDFPQWKADRLARTETRDMFNLGTLLTAQANGIKVVQAMDGQEGPTDPDCEHRDGQFYTVEQALSEVEHPNGTLAWRMLREPVTISRVSEVPDGVLASFDEANRVIYLSTELSTEDAKRFQHAVGEKLSV